MSFLIRGIEEQDLEGLFHLTKQFVLLNLPSDKKILRTKIEKSIESFRGELPKEEAEYMFVAIDLENQQLAGTSQIIAKHGTPDDPHLFFKILKKNLMSEDLGVGFIHKALRFQEDPDGPTEIGGLLVDRSYRRRPEKVGRQASMSRFLFMAMQPDSFEKRVLCELTPPLTEEGRSEFWEALGRRFTGMSYQEADQLSHVNKEFIRSLFPPEDIYLSLLDSKARLVLGRVGESTRPAQHLLEKIGFVYLNEVDPFDGGPHFGAKVKDIKPIKNSRHVKAKVATKGNFNQTGLVGVYHEGKFRAIQSAFEEDSNILKLPEKSAQQLQVEKGSAVSYFSF